MADKESTLSVLHNMPIFRLSLGSKELFHSNFLEYLWDCDRNCFITMIRNIFGDDDLFSGSCEYFLSREKENFDICIYHTADNKEEGTPIYDLILENKVKSIPYKEQLAEYVKKVEAKRKSENNAPVYVLLSLAKMFPDKDDNSDTISVYVDSHSAEWKVINYKRLNELINSQQAWMDKPYVPDYCSFIEALDKLGDEILDSMEEKPIFDKSEVISFKNERLHDLYIKMRCSWFAARLKEVLSSQNIPTKIINRYEEREDGVVNLNVAMNQGNGQIAAWICDGKRYKDGKNIANTFEIVIQGNQYRHGINQMSVTVSNVGKKRLNDLYSRLKDDPAYSDAFNFLTFGTSNDVYPNETKFHRQEKGKDKIEKTGPFDCYGESYIYRYEKIDGCLTRDLLEKMLKDIEKIYSQIPNL